MKKIIILCCMLLIVGGAFLSAQDIRAVAGTTATFLGTVNSATYYSLEGKVWALSVDENNLALIKEYKEKKAEADKIKKPKDKDKKLKDIEATYGPKFDKRMAELNTISDDKKEQASKKLNNANRNIVLALLIDLKALAQIPNVVKSVKAALDNKPKGMKAMKYRKDIKYLLYATKLLSNLPAQINEQMEAIKTTKEKVKAFADANTITLPETESMKATDTVDSFE